MAMAMAGPATLLAKAPISANSAIPVRSLTVVKMVPMSSEANSPWAMAASAMELRLKKWAPHDE